MITKLTSSLPTFKTLEFNRGLNILLAERHETSGARDTRNGTGKTSFIELVHFLLSERRNPNDDFHKQELVGSTFEALFKDNGSEFTVKKKAGAAKDELWRDDIELSPYDLRMDLVFST